MAFLLHQLLAEQAARRPEAPALLCGEDSLTFGQLEAEAGALAAELHRRGVRKGARVGLHMKRGIDAIVAACGILKTGAAYVPIDPSSPPDRIRFITAECDIRVLVTRVEHLSKVAAVPGEGTTLECIFVSGQGPRSVHSGPELVDWRMPASSPGAAPQVDVIDSDVAYILFTSGSTGRPKGVVITHRNALTFVESAFEYFRITPEDRVSHISPLHFDMSVVEVYLALRAGASLAILSEVTAMFPAKLAAEISRLGITVWNSVPSTLALLANSTALDQHDLSRLRLVLFAGEPFPLQYLRRLWEALPGAQFCNMYGQTEANSSTCYRVDRLPESDDALPIGKAMPNFEVFALDHEGNAISRAGQEGELYVRAQSVAQGYWNDPERTRAAFVANPLRLELAEKVYRTGDVVRLDAAGNYWFVGRKDQMFKSRGHRIEMGEIEAVLVSCPGVAQAVVTPVPDALVGNRIVAIVVPRERALTSESIAVHCRAHLVKYMQPDLIELCDSIPMTPSGKADRRAAARMITAATTHAEDG